MTKKLLLMCALVFGAMYSQAQTLDFRIGDLTVSASQFAASGSCIQVPVYIEDDRSAPASRDIRSLTFTLEITGDTSIIEGGAGANVVVANAYIGQALSAFAQGIRNPAVDLSNASGTGTATCSAAYNQATTGQGDAVDFPLGSQAALGGAWTINNGFDGSLKRGFVVSTTPGTVIGVTTGDPELVAVLEIPIAAGLNGMTTANLQVSAASGTNFNFMQFSTGPFNARDPFGNVEDVQFNLAAGYEGDITFVENQAPVASIDTPAGDTSVDFSGTVTFQGSATDAEDGSVSNLSWDFGNGMVQGTTDHTATGAGPHVVVFEVEGATTVTLTATDSDSATGTDSITVTVGANGAPVPTIDPASPADIGAGGTISWSGSATDPEGHAVTYAWTFEGGTPATSTDQNPGDVTYATPGMYTTTLVVTDAFSAMGTATASVTVLENQPPDVNITSALPAEVFQGQVVTFTGTATDPDGEIDGMSIVWTFEGGSPATAEGPGPHEVSFAAIGNHTVTLSANDNDGATGTDTQIVNVLELVCADATNVSISGDTITFMGTPGCVYELVANGVAQGIFATANEDGLGIFVVDVTDDTDYQVLNPVTGGGSPVVTSVPTLGEWGMIAFITMLMMAGAVMMRRNREQLS